MILALMGPLSDNVSGAMLGLGGELVSILTMDSAILLGDLIKASANQMGDCRRCLRETFEVISPITFKYAPLAP